jgi:hypothetical protein
MTNEMMAKRLREHAAELQSEGGNLFRARAFRAAAFELERLEKPVAEIFAQQGRAGLEVLPAIGKSLAYTLEGLLTTGELRTLRPLDAHREPARIFLGLPGVGHQLAERLQDQLKISTLEELAAAARAGRLAEVGVGRKRLAGILGAVEHRLGRAAAPLSPDQEPPVGELLAFDAEYRQGMQEQRLPLLAPHNNNPQRQRWLGVLRDERAGWQLRALFANTALAHRLGKTRDWVVIYFDCGSITGQRTVVSETRGDLAGLRVLRGREAECRRFYEARRSEVSSEPAA